MAEVNNKTFGPYEIPALDCTASTESDDNFEVDDDIFSEPYDQIVTDQFIEELATQRMNEWLNEHGEHLFALQMSKHLTKLIKKQERESRMGERNLQTDPLIIADALKNQTWSRMNVVPSKFAENLNWQKRNPGKGLEEWNKTQEK